MHVHLVILQEPINKFSKSDFFRDTLKIEWQQGFPKPVKGTNHTAVLHEGKVYIGGGEFGTADPSYQIDIYTPAINSWSNVPITTPCFWFGMTILNNRLIVVGGKIKTWRAINSIFSVERNQVIEYARMITPRSCATATGYQGMLIIIGGVDDRARRLASTELFDSTTRQSYTTDDLPRPYYWLTSVIVGNTLYLLGGISDSKASSAAFTASLDNLHTHQLKWNPHPDTPQCMPAAVSIQGRIITIGGTERKGNECTSDIYVFNNAVHNWEITGQYPSAIEKAAVVTVADDKIIVVGGTDKKGYLTNAVWIGTCKPIK